MSPVTKLFDLLTKFFNRLLWHRDFFAGSLILVGVVLAVWLLVFGLKNIHYAIIAAGVVLASIQLERNHQIQRREFIKDYMSRLFSDERINEIYHDLIYTYHDDLFEIIDSIAEKNNLKGDVDLENKPIFEPFENLQDGCRRKEGSRLYHPNVFQGSIEEKWLDIFLGHLNMIGYYLSQNMIDSIELMGYSRHMIRVVKSRGVIQEYIRVMDRKEKEYKEKFGGVPFEYLKSLFDAV